MIPLKNAEEIKSIREGGIIVAATLAELEKAVVTGIKTIELDKIAIDFIKSRKAESAFFGFKGFPGNICVSINHEVVHGIPSERQIKNGDIVSLDIGVLKNGFYADSAMTVIVGEVEEKAKSLVDSTRDALKKGIEKAVAGNRLGDISWAIQYFAEKAGFSVVRKFVGHGIGKELHEDPQIPNFGSPGQGPVLAEGMVLAIEPMVNLGKHDVEVSENGWTAITKDRCLAAHFEHSIAITKNGPMILTSLE